MLYYRSKSSGSVSGPSGWVCTWNKNRLAHAEYWPESLQQTQKPRHKSIGWRIEGNILSARLSRRVFEVKPWSNCMPQNTYPFTRPKKRGLISHPQTRW